MTVSVLVVDDNRRSATLIRNFLCDVRGISSVFVAHSVTEAQETLRVNRIDVALVDVCMSPQSGIELVRARSRLLSPPAYVMMTAFDSDSALQEALAVGAVGYLPKSSAPSLYVKTIFSAFEGRIFLAEQLVERFVRAGIASSRNQELQGKYLDLTIEQRRIFNLLMEGLSYREIAENLHFAESTIKEKTAGLLRSFGVNTRIELMALSKNLVLHEH